MCQVRDRAGFAALQARLSDLGVRHFLEEVSQEVYDAAQKISLHSQSTVDCAGDYGEDEVLVRTVYDFRPAVHLPKEAEAESAHQQRANTHKNNLISTSRDAFVLLRAFK